MTDLLEKAFAEAAKLPPADQEALAAWILEELAAENRWQESFKHSRNVLDKLADEAIDEHRRRRTKVLDTDEL